MYRSLGWVVIVSLYFVQTLQQAEQKGSLFLGYAKLAFFQ